MAYELPSVRRPSYYLVFFFKTIPLFLIQLPRGRRPTLTRNPLLYLQHAVTPYSAKEKKALRMMQWFRSEGKPVFPRLSHQ